MSSIAELHLIKQRLAELESTVEIIDKGQSRQEDKLRDRFAGMAMQAYFTDEGVGFDQEALAHAAKVAYRISDAMLIARGEK